MSKKKTFILYTTEGITTAPSGNEVENMQVLGFQSVLSNEYVVQKFLLEKENSWVIKSGFDSGQIRFRALEDWVERSKNRSGKNNGGYRREQSKRQRFII
jgi:hypothetical protein